MKKYILILLSLAIMSCQKTTSIDEEIIEGDIVINACGVKTFRKLVWAQDLIAGKGLCENNVLAGATLTMYDYKGDKVFYFRNPATSLGVCTYGLYNCSGKLLMGIPTEATNDFLDFEKNRTKEKLLWVK